MQSTFHVNLDDEMEISDLMNLLEARLAQLQARAATLEAEEDEESDFTKIETRDNIEILQDFVAQASSNQLEVLRWMKANPEQVSAHVMKNDLPFLAPHGALSGVFRPGRWKRLSGGTKEGFPFLQIAWNHEKGCGIYRGLTQDEANALNI